MHEELANQLSGGKNSAQPHIHTAFYERQHVCVINPRSRWVMSRNPSWMPSLLCKLVSGGKPCFFPGILVKTISGSRSSQRSSGRLLYYISWPRLYLLWICRKRYIYIYIYIAF